MSNRLPLGLRGDAVAFDTEGTGLNGYGGHRWVTYNFGNKLQPIIEHRRVIPARPFMYTFADWYGNTACVRGTVNPFTRAVTWAKGSQHEQAREILQNKRITKIGHNIRYDILMSAFDGIELEGPVVDTQIVTHIYTAGRELTYALKPLSRKYLNISEADEKALQVATNRARHEARQKHWSYATELVGGKQPWKADCWMAPDELCEEYGVLDSVRTMMFYRLWWRKIQKDRRMRALCEREHELLHTLKRMEDRGTRVHRPTVRKLTAFYEAYKQQQAATAVAEGAAGMNYKSTPQMTQMFYVKRHHIPNFTQTINKKTGQANYSLNGEHLLKMANGYAVPRSQMPVEWLFGKRYREYGYTLQKHRPTAANHAPRRQRDLDLFLRPPDPLAKAILEYKAADQTISSFLKVYERCWVKESKGVWVLHPNYRQTGTVTGRLSCSDPNLMQVASATTGRRKADIQSRPREAFGPRPGHVWYLPDYSQIEVWLFAFLSGEKRMQEALLSGRDYHGGIAKQVFGKRKDFEELADYYRKCAKLIMFCKLYGGGVKKVAMLIKSTLEAAQEFVEDYERQLPGVRRFMDQMIDLATVKGEIFNVFGRRYEFDEDFAYRAVNYLIQGTAADVMKNALLRVDRLLRTKYRDRVRLLLTIHDEIIVEAPVEMHSATLMRDIIRAMQQDQKLLGLPVPLPVEMKVVQSHERWHQAKKAKFIRSSLLAKAA